MNDKELQGTTQKTIRLENTLIDKINKMASENDSPLPFGRGLLVGFFYSYIFFEHEFELFCKVSIIFSASRS